MTAASPFSELFKIEDDPLFVRTVSMSLEAGACLKRGILPEEYISKAREVWLECIPDGVYHRAGVMDALLSPRLASLASNPEIDLLCIMFAQVDEHGNYLDAPAGYVRPNYRSAGFIPSYNRSPKAPRVDTAHEPDQPLLTDYIVAYLDILGFSELLAKIGVKELHRLYDGVLQRTVEESDATWTSHFVVDANSIYFESGHVPLQIALASDSILLWTPFQQHSLEFFLSRVNRLFCEFLSMGLPLRGVVTIGEGIFHKKTGTFLGQCLVDAAQLEKQSKWVGMIFQSSKTSRSLEIAVSDKNLIEFTPPFPLTRHDGLCLDWPKAWSRTYRIPAEALLMSLRDQSASADVRLKYDATLQFVRYSMEKGQYTHGESKVRYSYPNESDPTTPNSGANNSKER